MSIYPEGSTPSGADSKNQLMLKYAEELIATQFVDPHGFSIYPTGGATDNAIKTGDSLQNILAKLLGAAQGGYITADTSVIEADIAAIEDRDWVLVAGDSIDAASDVSQWTNGVISVMPVTSAPGGYPTDYGSVVVDRRVLSGATRVYKDYFGDLTYTSLWASGAWTVWSKVIKSDAGEIDDDLTFSGQTNLSGLTEYADDTAAGVGGLVLGDLYTTTGTIKIKL